MYNESNRCTIPGKTLTEKAYYLQEVGFDGMAVFAEPAQWNDKLTREVLDMEKTTGVRVGILADFFHMAIEEADIPGAILDGGSMIKHVHLGDNNRLAPGKGHTDWRSCMAALKQAGFAGYMNLECNLAGDLKTELMRIKRFFWEIEETL